MVNGPLLGVALVMDTRDLWEALCLPTSFQLLQSKHSRPGEFRKLGLTNTSKANTAVEMGQAVSTPDRNLHITSAMKWRGVQGGRAPSCADSRSPASSQLPSGRMREGDPSTLGEEYAGSALGGEQEASQIQVLGL
jgi:hypothetical protein